jgi:hypothetical protein
MEEKIRRQPKALDPKANNPFEALKSKTQA